MPFEDKKNSKELGVDTTRKFVVLEAVCFNEGDIVVIAKDDGSTCPYFKRLSDGKVDYCAWKRLKYLEDNPKFKVGDKVRVLSSNSGFKKGDIYTINEVRVGTNDGKYYYRKEKGVISGLKGEILELVKEETKPLTNTIITDIKDEAQYKRVQEKLFSMGCFWGGQKVGEFSNRGLGNKTITIFKEDGALDGSSKSYWYKYQPSWPRITASEFLGEIELTEDSQWDVPGAKRNGMPINIPKDYFDLDEKTPIRTSFTRHNSWYGKSIADIINNYYKPSTEVEGTKPMNNIVSFFNDLTVSGDDKELRKAGLKNEDLNWTGEALEIAKNLEAKELGYKNYEELSDKMPVSGIGALEAHTLFTKYYTKLLDTAKKFNRKDEKKAK